MIEVDYKMKLDEAVLQSDVVKIFDNLFFFEKSQLLWKINFLLDKLDKLWMNY